MPVHFVEGKKFAVTVPVAIIGGGACGLIAALAARDLGLDVLLVERDENLGGSTALSSGMVPASFTRFQREAGVADSPQRFAADIQRRSKGGGDVRMALSVTRASGPTLEWLSDRHGLVFQLVDGPPPPGHSVRRMHATPERTGAGLVERLRIAARKAGVAILTSARAADLFASEDGRVAGVAIHRDEAKREGDAISFGRDEGKREEIGVQALVLACSGFAANPAYVRRFVPEMVHARYVGHAGSAGDALHWATLLGAGVKDLSAYEAYASMSDAGGFLLPWALMTEGGFKVNGQGERFVNEEDGPAQSATPVLNQPDGAAWDIFDERIHRIGMTDENYRQAYSGGAIRRADSIEALAKLLGISEQGLARTLQHANDAQRGREFDMLGRDFTKKPALAAPFYGVKVTAAFVQTQGGVAVDAQARVVRPDATPFPNLFAAGNAACGISGPRVAGYLAGNGLLMATALARMAGLGAAKSILGAAGAAGGAGGEPIITP